MSAQGRATIQNEAGIHCRPSAQIVKEVKDYPGSIRISHEGESSDLRSMLSLMMLALTQGADVEIEVSGPDEEKQLQKLIQLLEHHYDFPAK